MKMMVRSLGALLVATLLAAGAWAQSISTAQLTGTVTDPKGAVVQGATVTARNAGKNFERSTLTGPDGSYHLLQLPPDTYQVTVDGKGFATYTNNAVVLNVGQTADLPVALSLATASETVQVSAQANMIETERTAPTNTVQQRAIENLPINGRNYINFTLTDSEATRDDAPSIGAAPTSGINFNGQRARSNLVNLDGMDQTDNSTNGVRSTIPQDAVQEFQIIDNSYAPEYGRASGGVVNIVSKSGTNAWHGSAYAYLRNRNIQATNPFSNVNQPAYTRVLPGFTLGGPIKKDKMFFFLSYEGTYRQESGFSNIGAGNFGLVPLPNAALFGLPPVPGLLVTPQQAAFLATAPVNLATATYAQLAVASDATALLGRLDPLSPVFASSGVPLPGSYVGLTTLTGNFPIKEHTSVYSLRFDNAINDRNQLMLRFNVSPSDVTGIEVNAQNQNFGQNAFSRTSTQNYHDFAGSAQHTWIVSNNKINEFRFQYARRGLRYDFSQAPGGSNVAVNIPGVAFFGREPFSFVNRVERRFQFSDDLSWAVGNHNMKFGADINYLPIVADFTVNFGGVYNFGELSATSVSPAFAGFPAFSPVQAYGLGIPQIFVQGLGNPHVNFSNTPMGYFAQDSWRIKPNLTLNYGLRYDVEITPQFALPNAISQQAYKALGLTQGIPTDTNNIAPRIGLAFDPGNDGKTVIRASYGIFYDHPLLGLAFLGGATNGSTTPQLVFAGGAPCNAASTVSPLNLNATNIFQGSLTNANCLPLAGLGYQPDQQRFNSFFPNSLFVNQNFLAAGIPLSILPFGFPENAGFQYASSNQANLTVERQLGHDFAVSVAYNFDGGHHLNRPINANAVKGNLLVQNWENAVLAGDPSALSGGPLGVQAATSSAMGCGGIAPNGQPYVNAALVSFFRPSGLNPSLTNLLPAPCVSFLTNVVMPFYGLGIPCNGGANCTGGFLNIPFSDMVANESNGSSVYHGLTTELRKRFGSHYQFLASYTYSHAIDDSTDLQSLLEPQDNYDPAAERASSTFDQRHRFVLSGVYQSGKTVGSNLMSRLGSYWTVAPIIELSSGRPFNILVGSDANFDFSSNTDRPNAVSAAQAAAPVPPGCLPAFASKFSPTGFFQPACFFDGSFDGAFTGSLDGNIGRNSATRPYTAFTDLRVGRTFHFGERMTLDGTVDMFNIINKFNVADVNPLYQQAGTPTAAFDARQFQFGLKLAF